MDITKSQKEFEDKYPKGLIHGVARLSNGEYASEFTRRIFLAWKAGRESIEVVLPALLPDEGYSDTAMHNFCRNDSVKKCAEALRTAGIRIKGESE